MAGFRRRAHGVGVGSILLFGIARECWLAKQAVATLARAPRLTLGHAQA